MPHRDALAAAGNEVEICVESLEEHVQSAETEKAPFDESNRGDALVDLYDDNDKLIGQPEIISVNNCSQEEQGFRMEEWRQTQKDSTRESRGNEPNKRRKRMKQQLVHPYLRHLKVKKKKLKQLKLPHYEHDLRLTENRDLSLTYQDSRLLSNNETNEINSPLSPCMLQGANKNSPATVIRDRETPQRSAYRSTLIHEVESRTILSKLSPERSQDQHVLIYSESDEKPDLQERPFLMNKLNL